MSTRYRVNLSDRARKQYDALDRPVRRRLDRTIESLATTRVQPAPPRSGADTVT